MGRIITFEPIQEGEGTPSPDNIRPILPGLTIDGIGNIYGGYVDFDTGILTKTWTSWIRDGVTSVASNLGTYSDTSEYTNCRGFTGVRLIDIPNDVSYNDTSCYKCSHFFWYTYSYRRLLTPDVTIAWTSSQRYVTFCSSTFTTLEEYNDWLKEQYDNGTPVRMVVKRSAANYTEYQLTPEQLTQAYNQLVVTPPSMLEKRRRMIMSQPHLTSASANPLTFQTDISANLKDCKIYFEPVQEGSGDPSPDNVRPISGWDGVTITRCGKNLVGAEQWKSLLQAESLQEQEDEDGKYLDFYGWRAGFKAFSKNDVKQNTPYTFIIKTKAAESTAFIVVLYSDETFSTFTVGPGLQVVKFTTNANKTIQMIKIQQRNIHVKLYLYESGMFEGNIPVTDYEPYTGTSITIPFPQTIYGGYVDLVKGEVVEEWKSEMMSSYTWTNHSTSSSISRWKCSDIPVKPAPTKNDAFHGISDRLLPIAYNGSWNSYYRISPSSDGHSNTFVILPAMTAQEANDFFATALLCYELATPIAYQLTPQTIKTLKGINNIWSDANGNIEVKFWKH